MRLIDRFTTRDGSWIPDDRPLSITSIAVERYGADRDMLGGANHIYVKAPLGSDVLFMTEGGQNVFHTITPSSGWANMPMFHSSAYNPSDGQNGPWNVYVNSQPVAFGIGLPYGWHVSTFLVASVDEQPAPPLAPALPSAALLAAQQARAYLDVVIQELGGNP